MTIIASLKAFKLAHCYTLGSSKVYKQDAVPFVRCGSFVSSRASMEYLGTADGVL